MKLINLFLLILFLSGCNVNTAYNPNYHILLEEDTNSSLGPLDEEIKSQ